MRHLTSLCLCALALAACGNETVNPVVPEGAPTTTSSPPPPTKPVKRTIETRNPFGGPPGNLLVDGDFEVSISFEGSGEQLAWIAVTPNGEPGYLRGETGGICKSGTHCAVLEKGAWLYGKGAAAKDVGLVASVWVKPPEGEDCSVASAELIHCNFTGVSVALAAASRDPGPGGWCEHRGTVDVQQSAVCMKVDHIGLDAGPVLVDYATVLPADGTTPMSKMTAMPSARRAATQRVLDTLRRRLPFGDPPTRLPTFGSR